MVCACMALMVLHFDVAGEMHGAKPVVNPVGSSGNAAAPYSDEAAQVQNHLAAVTFDWTNHSDFKSSIGSHFGPGPSTNSSN